LEKAGFRILRQGKHIVMSDGIRILTIPRHNPVNGFTMGGIALMPGYQLRSSRSFSKQSLAADGAMHFSQVIFYP
jgi:hypothetical protein